MIFFLFQVWRKATSTRDPNQPTLWAFCDRPTKLTVLPTTGYPLVLSTETVHTLPTLPHCVACFEILFLFLIFLRRNTRGVLLHLLERLFSWTRTEEQDFKQDCPWPHDQPPIFYTRLFITQTTLTTRRSLLCTFCFDLSCPVCSFNGVPERYHCSSKHLPLVVCIWNQDWLAQLGSCWPGPL